MIKTILKLQSPRTRLPTTATSRIHTQPTHHPGSTCSSNPGHPIPGRRADRSPHSPWRKLWCGKRGHLLCKLDVARHVGAGQRPPLDAARGDGGPPDQPQSCPGSAVDLRLHLLLGRPQRRWGRTYARDEPLRDLHEFAIRLANLHLRGPVVQFWLQRVLRHCDRLRPRLWLHRQRLRPWLHVLVSKPQPQPNETRLRSQLVD